MLDLNVLVPDDCPSFYFETSVDFDYPENLSMRILISEAHYVGALGMI